MVDQLRTLDPAQVAANLDRVQEQIRAAGRRPQDVEILAAIKYLPADLLPALAAGGITTVGENRAQQLAEKQAAHRDAFPHWDFIGQLQSRKVRDLVGRVRFIHSVASDTALVQLERHLTPETDTRILIEVNIDGDPAKDGVAPGDLARVLERCAASGIPVAGLMTMPAHASDPEQSRAAFAELARLGRGHGLAQLSMGTSQDYRVALEEGATIVRLGSTLFGSS